MKLGKVEHYVICQLHTYIMMSYMIIDKEKSKWLNFSIKGKLQSGVLVKKHFQDDWQKSQSSKPHRRISQNKKPV